MAFTGYVFENAAAISPYLEQPQTGATSQFCSELAKKLQCYVIAGYPESLKSEDLSNKSNDVEVQEGRSSEADVQHVGANSAAMYDPEGDWVGGYRKTHLFETDKTWAKAGTGFATFILPSPIQTMSVGICMDLNPQIPGWRLAEGPYEIADYCLEKQANVLVLLNAWLDSGNESDEVHDWQTLNYWAARLRPLWTDGKDNDPDAESSHDEHEHDSKEETKSRGKETVVVICNRSGEENGKTFAGTSAIFSMIAGSGRPKLLDMMERREEGVRIWNIQV